VAGWRHFTVCYHVCLCLCFGCATSIPLPSTACYSLAPGFIATTSAGHSLPPAFWGIFILDTSIPRLCRGEPPQLPRFSLRPFAKTLPRLLLTPLGCLFH